MLDERPYIPKIPAPERPRPIPAHVQAERMRIFRLQMERNRLVNLERRFDRAAAAAAAARPRTVAGWRRVLAQYE
jgi:hypothetical protein